MGEFEALDSGDNCCCGIVVEVTACAACCVRDAIYSGNGVGSGAASRTKGVFDEDESGGEGNLEVPSEDGSGFSSVAASVDSQDRFDGVVLGADGF